MPQKQNRPVSVACFGESLWDLLPRGLFLGGAPLNVSYHLSRNGARALPISAVGRDFLGAEALRRIAQWALDSRFINRDTTLPTGTVQATLDPKGAARYQIAENVAWDRICVSSALLSHPAPAALVFGTLALREEPNRKAFQRLIKAWPSSLRVLDLNLRAPFDRNETVAFALKHAQVVKLNDEELSRMVGQVSKTPTRLQRAAREFADLHRLARVCVTAGASGAGLLWDGDWDWEDSRPTVVRDTVGAGDAFLAALLAAIVIKSKPAPAALASACRLGEFVASHDGATPSYSLDGRGNPRATIV